MCVVSSNQLPARKTTLSCGLSLYIADRCAVRGIMNQPNVGQRKEGFFTMALDYESIGKRIKGYRTQRNISQEELSERINAGPRYITKVENAVIRPSLESLVYIANALNVSSDDLLHDNLTVSTSRAGSEIHRLLLDCNLDEQKMLSRTVQFMKALLREFGI